MATFILARDLYRSLREDLEEAEGAGFFLADYRAEGHVFRFREWRNIPDDAFESRSGLHLVLRDEMRGEIIRWAWTEGASLVEAHSHAFGPAQFSPSDLDGLDEWVPHVWWRLRGRPYAAIVVAERTLDALAWIEGADVPEQVGTLDVVGEGSIPSTGRTLARMAAWRKRHHGA